MSTLEPRRPDPAPLLWKVAKDAAAELGYGFAPDCERAFRSMLEVAAPEIDSGIRAPFDESMDRARDATVRLVGAMVAAARANQLRLLQEGTLAEALARLCPLWPFC